MSSASAAAPAAAASSSASQTPAAAAAAAAPAAASGTKPAVQPSEVGWLFVPQYYTFLNQNPGRLHCFYTKKSTLVHGTELEDTQPCFGQQEIHNKILSLGFSDCKVFVSNVDSQSSAAGGILIQVLGEMSNASGPWRKFAQTFFLAEQPNGYFVLNDIFRFLKEDDADVEADGEAEAEVAAQPAVDATPEQDSQASKAAEPKAAEAAPAAAAEPAAPAPTTVPAAEKPAAAAPAPAAAAPTTNGTSKPEAVVAEDAKPEAGVDAKVATVSAAAVAPAAPAGQAAADEAAAAPAQPEAKTEATPAAASASKTDAPAPAAESEPARLAAPAAPAAPKTWASLAASNSKGWGATASESRGVSAARTPAAAPAAPRQAPAAQTNGAPSAPAAAARPQANGTGQASQAYQNASTQNHGGVFIKNVLVAEMPEEGLQAVLERLFGPMKECQVIPSKACAFGEFASVESARKAIIMSLRPQDGGSGGVPVNDKGFTVTVEEKRKMGERPTPSGRGGMRGGAGGERGGFRGGRGGRGAPAGRGRGAAPTQK
ncbi:hypothetical protein FA09DRAFT_334747 [Tilletiopsis washingtonensis]|uniref:NTF2-domain-containing protein n=1 Tax=Tilletiopsis washingtonensis TaxID=58919 RepID=A0A316Z529_9BASI|nr:hypothetical protein FA09DRAFT_334747 [Tilletiopsis washingtonensis]PWN96877.1 hypothetical protein FA09DRAFT_334747 [Tilletiopsis washingtonensis]